MPLRADNAGGLVDDNTVAELATRLPDPDARRSLIEICAPLAHRLARRFARASEHTEDLEQVAVVGLIKAVDNYEPARGNLMAYATVVITGELKHYLRDRSQPVRMPRRLRRRLHVVEDAVDELTQLLGRSPTVAEIARHAGLTAEAVLEAHAAARHRGALSIDELDADDGDSVLPDTSHDEERLFIEEWIVIEPSLSSLDSRQRRILYLRFYRGLTQTQIAAELGISQVQVSRVLAATLRDLRRRVT